MPTSACSPAAALRRSTHPAATPLLIVRNPAASYWMEAVYFPSSPLKEIRDKHAPSAKISYDPGTDPAAAAKLAATSQIAIVFVNQPMSEGRTPAPSASRSIRTPSSLPSPPPIPHHRRAGKRRPGRPCPGPTDVRPSSKPGIPASAARRLIANILFGDVNPSGNLASHLRQDRRPAAPPGGRRDGPDRATRHCRPPSPR